MKITPSIFFLEYLLAIGLATLIDANDNIQSSVVETAETSYVNQPYYRQSTSYPWYSSRFRSYQRRYPYYYSGYNRGRGYYNRIYSPLYNGGLGGIFGIFGGLASGGYGGYHRGIATSVFDGDSIINHNHHHIYNDNDNYHSHNEEHYFDGTDNGGRSDENYDAQHDHGSDNDNVGGVEGQGSDFGGDVDVGADGDGDGGDGDVGDGDGGDGDGGGGDSID